MSLRDFLLGFLIGVSVTFVAFVCLRNFEHDNTAQKTIEKPKPEESRTSDRIRRHNDLFWYDETGGLVDPSFATEGAWSPVSVDYLVVPFFAGNLVSINYGTYDTQTADRNEYVEILIQLPLEPKIGEDILLRPVGPNSIDDVIAETRNVFLTMDPGEISIHRFMNPVSSVLENPPSETIGHCKLLKMSETTVDLHLTISAVVGVGTLELDQPYSLQRKVGVSR